jgi:iron complex outermembrane receptor protein
LSISRRLGAAAIAILASISAAAAEEPLEEVVVTATRQERPIGDVPASVSAFTRDDMEMRDVKSFADLVRYTPGVSFDPTTKNITIRGIGSTAGAGTTGIYIDDTPIQMRSLYYNSNNALPAVFDLDRVEVLRGPQGTLFGAGSEGGTVRYVMAQPSLTNASSYGHAETSVTENGAPSYEAGLALGGPLLDGTLGFRASLWGRRDGGWIDAVDSSKHTTAPKSNGTDTYVGRMALAWAPTPDLQITPSINFQDRQQGNADQYWVGISDPAKGAFRTATPERLADKDRFYLPAVSVKYSMAASDLIGTASYFDRLQHVGGYSATLYNLSYFQQLVDPSQGSGPTDPMLNPCAACRSDLYPLLTATGLNLPDLPEYRAISVIANAQRNFTTEVRVQSKGQERFSWVAGLFLADDRQESSDTLRDPQLGDITSYLFGEELSDAWGEGLLPNGVGFLNRTIAHDRQVAGYLDGTLEIGGGVSVEAGVRVAWTQFKFENMADGPENFGPSGGSGTQEETPVSPKIGVSYRPDEGELFYANVARGYRIGGANAPFPESSCQADLTVLGISKIPSDYKSDSDISYEVGAKNSLLGGSLSVEASAYYTDWSDIQQPNYLPSCGFQYTANLGKAVSKGFDLQARYRPVSFLLLDLAVGYNDARYAADTRSGSDPAAPLLVARGDTLGGAPWTFAFGAQFGYDVLGYESFLRADYTYASQNRSSTPYQNSATTSYDPSLLSDPSTSFLSVRAGTAVGDWELGLIVQNLLNDHPRLGLSHQDSNTLLYEASTWRPRTVGLTLSYRS